MVNRVEDLARKVIDIDGRLEKIRTQRLQIDHYRALERHPIKTIPDFDPSKYQYYSAVDFRGVRLLSIKSPSMDAARTLLTGKFIRRGFKIKAYRSLYDRWERGGFAIARGIPEKVVKIEHETNNRKDRIGHPLKQVRRRPKLAKHIRRRKNKERIRIQSKIRRRR